MATRIQPVQQMKLYDSRDVVTLQTFTPGVYFQQLETQGNSILSTVFVSTLSVGANVKVEYIESGAGTDEGESIPLEEHPLLTTAPQSSKILVTRMHNKPYIKITVTGGNARVGVYVTVVASFASELDSALLFEGEPFLENVIKGLMIAGVDDDTDSVQFMRFKNGKLQVDIGQSNSGASLNLFEEDSIAGGTTADVLTYTVPVGKILTLSAIECDGENIATYRVKRGSNTIAKKSTTFWADEVFFDFRTGRSIDESGLDIAAGETIKVEVENFRTSIADFCARLIGVLSDEP